MGVSSEKVPVGSVVLSKECEFEITGVDSDSLVIDEIDPELSKNVVVYNTDDLDESQFESGIMDPELDQALETVNTSR